MFTRLLIAFQFLTIVPLPARLYENRELRDLDVGTSSALFPLVGFFKGVLFYILYLLIKDGFSPELTAAVLLVASVLINGGFHLDGLADTFDAIASRKSRDKKLEIMKDSTTGPAGVASITLSLLLKYLLIKGLLNSGQSSALILFPVVGAWVMVPAMFHSNAARPEGLGKLFVENTTSRELTVSTTLLLFIILILSLLSGTSALKPLIGILIAYLVTVILLRVYKRQFGGLTGDTLGSIAEIGELVFLLLLSIR